MECQESIKTRRARGCRLLRARFCWSPFLLVILTIQAHAAPPTLTHLFPAGGQRGTKVVVTATGSFTWPVSVWAPGLEVKPGKEAGKLEISIPKDLAADRAWIRLYNADGASTSAPFLIGSLKEISETEPNDAPRTAQHVAEASCVVNGVLSKPGDVDGFSVRVNAGQTLVAAVDAHTRLGSPMDAILQVTSVDGDVLAENNDSFGYDPRLAFTATKSGVYVVRIFAFPADPGTAISFSGAPNYIYRLTLTTGPYITHAVPLAVSRTKPGEVEVRGWNISPGTRLPVRPLGGLKLAEYFESEAAPDLRIPADAGLGLAFSPALAGAARVRLTALAVVEPTTPANAKSPPSVLMDSTVTGWLRTPRQTDVYRLALKKGQHFVVSVESNHLHFPLDPVVKLLNPDGAVVADVDDTGTTRDLAFAHVATKDGDYRVVVQDRYRHGGPRHVYRLTVRRETPDFELTTTSESIIVTAAKPVEIPIKVQRYGAVGPIVLRVVGLPDGVTAAPAVSEPTGPSAAAVTLKLTCKGKAFSGPVRLVGLASQPKGLERRVRTAPRLNAAFETIWLTSK
ncbi:MAG: pre-peptidase [Planctomycetes bacterium]|nr:pre-peptidase [Planctomycetota bacterium]